MAGERRRGFTFKPKGTKEAASLARALVADGIDFDLDHGYHFRIHASHEHVQNALHKELKRLDDVDGSGYSPGLS